MSDAQKLQCKVKIGCAYEPKWFEKRQTNGWYSGKNPPLDRDSMTLQDALLNSTAFTPRTSLRTWVWMVVCGLALIATYACTYFF
jgi:hypothetical protein